LGIIENILEVAKRGTTVNSLGDCLKNQKG